MDNIILKISYIKVGLKLICLKVKVNKKVNHIHLLATIIQEKKVKES